MSDHAREGDRLEARTAEHTAASAGTESAGGIHSIRLRGPWTWRPVVEPQDLPHGSLATSPPDLREDPGFARTATARGDDDGRFQAPQGLRHVVVPPGIAWILLERTFHRPTGLTEADQLYLRFRLPQVTQAWLNHAPQQIQATDDRWHVTPLLAAHNRLLLQWPVEAVATTHVWDVALEIETGRIE